MTKLCPFKEKIQRQYLSTNVGLPVQWHNTAKLPSGTCFKPFTLPTAHWTLGGDVADSL